MNNENHKTASPLNSVVGRISFKSIVKSIPGAVYLGDDWSMSEKIAAINLVRSGGYTANQVLSLLSFTPSEWSASEKRIIMRKLHELRHPPNPSDQRVGASPAPSESRC